MNMQPIQSENIDAAGYDEETQTMEVAFDKGPVYRYSNISKGEWEAFLHGKPSPGKYFYHHIRTRYPYVRIG